MLPDGELDVKDRKLVRGMVVWTARKMALLGTEALVMREDMGVKDRERSFVRDS